MKNFKITPVSSKELLQYQTTRKDDLGNEIKEELAKGLGPCRVSLKPFLPYEDKRFLLSYSPFDKVNVYYQSGPIYISSEPVEEYSDIYRFPPEIKADKVNFPLTLVGYDKNQMMKFSKIVGDRDVDELIVEIFENKPKIDFLHARNSSACCYICKIERV